MKKLIWILSVLFFAACAATGRLQPDEKEWLTMQQKVPGVSFEEVKKGFHLYKLNCSGCHRLHRPNEFTEQQWNKNLDEMIPKAKLENDTAKQQLIKYYLISKSK